jgi:hypothetical protein
MSRSSADLAKPTDGPDTPSMANTRPMGLGANRRPPFSCYLAHQARPAPCAPWLVLYILPGGQIAAPQLGRTSCGQLTRSEKL